jgi:N-carbamoyl-D-amino-acid hydrolase
MTAPAASKPRTVVVGVAQVGPIAGPDTRPARVAVLLRLLRRAHARGCDLVICPELALTPFFPRLYFADIGETDRFVERSMPSAETEPLFAEAARLGIAFYLGYAELDLDHGPPRRFNTSILVDSAGAIVGKYRKVHLPGQRDRDPRYPLRGYEKRYFEVGDLGFPVWQALGGTIGMCICNDRRWPETFRVLGLRGAELVTLGYNTPAINTAAPAEPAHLRVFHHLVTMQAAAYQNGTWIAAAARAGIEEGHHLIGGSCIIAPTGEVVALASSEGEELIVAECDLDAGKYIRETVFNFAAHRRPEHYGLITQRDPTAHEA